MSFLADIGNFFCDISGVTTFTNMQQAKAVQEAAYYQQLAIKDIAFQNEVLKKENRSLMQDLQLYKAKEFARLVDYNQKVDQRNSTLDDRPTLGEDDPIH